MQHNAHQERLKVSTDRRPADVDGFWLAAVHSVTRTTPRAGLRRRIVPWTVAVVLLIALAAAGTAFATRTYGLMWGCIGVALAVALFAAVTHTWRASTRYKQPLGAPTDRDRDMPERRARDRVSREG